MPEFEVILAANGCIVQAAIQDQTCLHSKQTHVFNSPKDLGDFMERWLAKHLAQEKK